MAGHGASGSGNGVAGGSSRGGRAGREGVVAVELGV